MPTIREYTDPDEQSWLRCRVLGFLDTAYYDDVATRKPPRDLQLVATTAANGRPRSSRTPGPAATASPHPGLQGDEVAGLLDASLNGPEATIETIVVHPDHRRRGIARALLDEACARLAAAGAHQVDAWTRDDPGTLAWYAEHGFVEQMRYLHVYASTPAEAAAFAHRADLMPQAGFFHAWIEHEQALRAEFQRVHVCRRFVKPLHH